VWFDAAEHAAVEAAAVRLAVELGLGQAGREVSAGRVRLRRRSGVPVGPDVVVERPSVVRGAPAAVPALSRAEAFRLAAGRRSGS
jgi:hypothetical protein